MAGQHPQFPLFPPKDFFFGTPSTQDRRNVSFLLPDSKPPTRRYFPLAGMFDRISGGGNSGGPALPQPHHQLPPPSDVFAPSAPFPAHIPPVEIETSRMQYQRIPPTSLFSPPPLERSTTTTFLPGNSSHLMVESPQHPPTSSFSSSTTCLPELTSSFSRLPPLPSPDELLLGRRSSQLPPPGLAPFWRGDDHFPHSPPNKLSSSFPERTADCNDFSRSLASDSFPPTFQNQNGQRSNRVFILPISSSVDSEPEGPTPSLDRFRERANCNERMAMFPSPSSSLEVRAPNNPRNFIPPFQSPRNPPPPHTTPFAPSPQTQFVGHLPEQIPRRDSSPPKKLLLSFHPSSPNEYRQSVRSSSFNDSRELPQLRTPMTQQFQTNPISVTQSEPVVRPGSPSSTSHNFPSCPVVTSVAGGGSDPVIRKRKERTSLKKLRQKSSPSSSSSSPDAQNEQQQKEEKSQRKKKAPQQRFWKDEDMIEAIKMVQSKKMTSREASEVYNVPRSTLWDRVSGRVTHGVDQRTKRAELRREELTKNLEKVWGKPSAKEESTQTLDVVEESSSSSSSIKETTTTSSEERAGKRRKHNWKDEDMAKAIQMVKVSKVSTRVAAEFCQVPRSTLFDRVSGRVPWEK